MRWMLAVSEAVLFVDSAAAVGTVLRTLGTATRKVPNPRPSEFFTFRRTGGVPNSIVSDVATITVEAWADSPGASHDLAQQGLQALKDAAHTTVGDAQIYKVSVVGGVADFPDPESDQDRHVFSVTVSTRGVESAPS